MIQVKQALLAALHQAAEVVAPGHGLSLAFESPRHASHGDLAITAAMALARPQKKNPREIAQALLKTFGEQPATQQWVEQLEIAGPGFINLRLKPAARQSVVAEVLAQGTCFGRQADTGKRVMVEFVSANPTGPLHVGHGRQGALGDALCNLLSTQGWQVHREFYYNDAGVQIATLALSVQARARGLQPGGPGWPEAAYNGDYIADIAHDFLARKTVRADDRSFTASGDVEDLDSIRQFAVAYLRHEQDLDLQAFGVRFDHYYLESSLYSSGRVEQAVQRLVSAGKTYEDGGALWLRTTDYGDDKDRVMRKSATVDADGRTSEGGYTYFVPDVAYHLHKWERGFDKVINVQGSDHHGTIARVRAGLQAAATGVPQGWPDYVLHKMVTVMRGGQEVKISKRAGSYVTLRDLIDWTSRDAVRFFLISRKADTEFTFDVDLALQQNDENPVFYVQYAHARICSVIQQWLQQGGDESSLRGADLSRLSAPSEAALMLKLAQYPEMLTGATEALAPHDVAFYARELAGAFHSYYAAERFLVEDRELARARLALLAATRQVLANALTVLGVGAPQRMERAEREERQEPQAPTEVAPMGTSQRGGTLVGLAVGLLLGLAIALGVAMYVSKVPVPFVDKLPQRSAEQDAAETERNRNWNPNAPLSGKTPLPSAAGTGNGSAPSSSGEGASGGAGVATMPTTPGGMAPILPPPAGAAPPTARAPEPRVELTGLFIQAGAYSRQEEAEQQRARLAMLGFTARISEREQGGRSVFRVRVGPYETREETQGPMDRLMAAGVEVSLVRVERSNTP